MKLRDPSEEKLEVLEWKPEESALTTILRSDEANGSVVRARAAQRAWLNA